MHIHILKYTQIKHKNNIYVHNDIEIIRPTNSKLLLGKQKNP